MALFKKIFGGEEPDKGAKDFRSKRGGRRATKPVPEGVSLTSPS